jgi:hypothetical protein
MRESTPLQRRVTHSKRTTYRPCMVDVTKRTTASRQRALESSPTLRRTRSS